MTQDHDVFHKVGRGGAGNYYSSQQAQDVSNGQTTPNSSALKENPPGDLTTSVATPPTASSGGLARAGRGGAGNYLNTAQPLGQDEQRAMASKVAVAVDSSLKNTQYRGGLGGRGGAGNWAGEDKGKKAEEEGRGLLERTAELEKRAKESVEKSLRMPDRVHHGRDKKTEQQ